MFIATLSWSGTYSGLCTGTQLMNISPSSLSLDGIPEGFSDCNLGGIRASMVLMVKSWMSGRDAIRSTHGTFPHSLSGRTGRDVYSACVSKDRLSLTRKEKLWSKLCRCMGMTQRDVVGREVGGGFRFGNACKN